MKSITDSSFGQDVLKETKPVVVDFWAEWCGPCRMLTPVLEELSQEMGDAVHITKMNIDENPETPTSYGVRSIPTLILFKDGEVKAIHTGSSPKSTIKNWIESNISS